VTSRNSSTFHLHAGFWSLFDQGLVSAGNFATQLILARVLIVTEYGTFALIYGLIFLLVGSLGTLITYPLSVCGATLIHEDFKQLVGRSLMLSGAVLIPECLILGGALFTLGRANLFLPAACALFCWQLQETLRRSLMSRLAHSSAVWGDGLSYLGQALCVGAATRFGVVTLPLIFMAIAATSAVAAVVQILQVRPIVRSHAIWKTASDYWRQGRWASLTNLSNGITQQLFPWLLALMEGIGEAGDLQAIINPLKIFNPILIGIQNVIVPSGAALRFQRGAKEATMSGVRYSLLGVVLLLPYLVFLFAWPHSALQMFYGANSHFSHLIRPLRICVCAYAMGFLAETVSSILLGIGLPKTSLYGQAISTVVGLAVSVPLILRFQLIGAIMGLGLCASIKFVIGIYSLLAQPPKSGMHAVEYLKSMDSV
jgi:O-antigen/teichoic acid export membrane protein